MKFNPLTGAFDMVSIEDLSGYLKLDQASPQTFTNFAGGTGLMKVTAGVLGLDTSTYLTSVTAHNLLSATHGDTLADSVVQGDVMVGNATPKWSRLAANATATRKYLSQISGGVPSWETVSSVSFGTTTQIPYMNAGGTDFLYSAGFVFNGTSLGIGLTTPGATLHIKASTSTGQGLIIEDNDTTQQMSLLRNNTDGNYEFDSTFANAVFVFKKPISFGGFSFSGSLTYPYSFTRNGSTGFLEIKGSQPGYTGFEFINDDGTHHFTIIDNGNVLLPVDNQKLLFGTGQDASIYYDGSNFQFKSREVGTGNFVFTGGQLEINTAANYRGLLINGTGNSALTFQDGTTYATMGLLSGKLVLAKGQYTNSTAYMYFGTAGSGASIHSADSSNLYGTGCINAEVAIGAAYPSFHALMRGTPSGSEKAYIVTSGPYYTEDQIVLYYKGGAVFNEAGNDADFRVEGDTVANLLFVDASTDRVGIGTATPGEKLEVNGNIKLTADNNILKFGEDAHIYFDGTNWIFNPRVTGTGALQILNGGTQVATEFTTVTSQGVMILRRGALSTNTTTVVPTNTSMLQMIANATVGMRTAAYSNTAGNASFFQFNRWRGSDVAATPALSGDAVFRITGGAGYRSYVDDSEGVASANLSLLTAQFRMVMDGDAKQYGTHQQAPVAIAFETNHKLTTGTSLYQQRGWLTSWGNFGFGTVTPTYKVDVQGYYDVTTVKTVSDQVDYDLSIGGTFTGTYNTFIIEIDAGDDASADPNTFKWSDDDGATYTEGVEITGAEQTLSNGITVTFDSTTGYATGEQWVTKAVFANPFNAQTSAGVSVVSVLDNGNFKTNGGRIGKVTTVTDTYQILVTDETVVCNKATAFTCTLPVGVVGQVFSIKNIGAGVVTVSLAGDTIDGVATQTVNQWDCMKIMCRASNLWIIV